MLRYSPTKQSFSSRTQFFLKVCLSVHLSPTTFLRQIAAYTHSAHATGDSGRHWQGADVCVGGGDTLS